MLQHTPDRPSGGTSPWWSGFVDSRVGRRITFAAIIVAAVLCMAMILTHKATTTTVPPMPRIAR